MNNPLDKPGEPFDFAMFNVRVSARKRKGEPFYTLSAEIEPELWEKFMKADIEGAIFAGRLFRSVDGEPEQEKKPAPPQANGHPFGETARAIIAYGTFNAPEVLKAIGTDKEFRAWIEQQPSCISGATDAENGRNIACHVRRAADAGTGYKPPYMCVPLTNKEHGHQHQHGELSLLRQPWNHKKYVDWQKAEVTVEHAKDWFTDRALLYRTEWARKTLAKLLGKESLGDVMPLVIHRWAKERDLLRFMPREISNLQPK